MAVEIVQSKLLLVEGRDEENFFSALLEHLLIPNVQVVQYGGKDNLRPFLPALKLTPGWANVESLGVTRDADYSAEDAFKSIQGALLNAGLPAPSDMMVPSGGSPQVIVATLPPGAERGMLEDLCLSSVSNDPAMTCIEQYFRCLEACPGPPPRPLAKAKVHAFLASREEPDKRLGEAALAGYWSWDSAAFNPVKYLLITL